MYTLGINAAYHDPAAALLKDGQVLAAAEEERFTKIKHGKRPLPFSTWELPFHAIDYCLKQAASIYQPSTMSPIPMSLASCRDSKTRRPLVRCLLPSNWPPPVLRCTARIITLGRVVLWFDATCARTAARWCATASATTASPGDRALTSYVALRKASPGTCRERLSVRTIRRVSSHDTRWSW